MGKRVLVVSTVEGAEERLRDALATFAADEIVVVVRPEEEAGAVEHAATEGISRSVDGIPVRRLVASD